MIMISDYVMIPENTVSILQLDLISILLIMNTL